MKRRLFFLLVFASLSLVIQSAHSSNLEVTISNVKSNKGQLRIGLYNSAQTFPHIGKEFMGVNVRPKSHSSVVQFSALMPGRYAIAVVHDEDENGKLNTGWFGIPKEGYGFSNNASDGGSAANFSSAAIDIGDDNQTVEIRLQY